MASKFLSPGVFTTETDLSFLAQGVAGIGAAVVGRTSKGPAFVPIVVRGFDDFADRFGNVDPRMQLPYAARNYLRNATALTVVRVLGHDDGTTTTNGYTVGGIAAITDSGSNGQVLATVEHSGGISGITVLGVAADANNFVFRVGTLFGATASFLTSSANYIEKVLNTDPTKYSTYGHYLSRVFSYVTPAASASWSAAAIQSGVNSFARNFEGGVSAWVKSQPVGGTDFNMFRFFTLAHGRQTVTGVKVMVSNVKPSPSPTATPFGTFDVIVRDFGDTDQHQVILESFIGCSMDPSAGSYVARRIGDMNETFDTTQRKFVAVGTYPNRSKFIRIDLDTASNSPATALPWGHRGYTKGLFNSGSVINDLPLQPNLVDRAGNIDSNICFGISFVSGGIDDRMHAYANSANLGTDSDFSLGFLTSSYVQGRQVWTYSTATPAAQYHQAVYASASIYKFVLPFQGGFDGFDLRVNDPLYLTNAADETDIGVVSAKRALDTVANPDAFDMNLLAVPGIHNLKVTDKARSVVNDRKDTLFIMDVTGSSVAEAIAGLKNREVDDNYSAAYYPDLRLNDKTANRVIRVAPSVAVIGAIAFSDRVSAPFFAPAGLNRGGLSQFDIIDVADRLTFSDRNDLYDNRLNPIATFPNEGINIFGQKTLQIRASALDRVNVRRLLIFAKKTISSAAKFLLFEPNSPATWQRFTNAVNPILDKIKQDQGLVRFKVVMDTTTNTDDLVDRNIMTGKIFLQPTKAAEFIDLSFIITNAGVSFGE